MTEWLLIVNWISMLSVVGIVFGLPVISRDFDLINLHPMSFSLSLPFPQNLSTHCLAWSNIWELTWAILSFSHPFCCFNLPKISHLVYLLSFLILQFIYYSNLPKNHVISPDLPFEQACFLPSSLPSFFSSFFPGVFCCCFVLIQRFCMYHYPLIALTPDMFT